MQRNKLYDLNPDWAAAEIHGQASKIGKAKLKI
jgi:hypothetical protein